MFVDGKRQKGILTAVAFFIIMLLPAISHAQAGQLLSLYGMAGVECFSETVRAVPPVYRDRFTRALAGEQGKQVVDLMAERGFAPVPGSEMLVLGLPGGTMYAAVPLESDRRLPSLTCSPEELQQADDYRISSFLSYKSSETGEGSFCFIEVFEHRETDSRSKIRWIFPGDGGFELGVEGFLPRIRQVYPENAPAALATATYGVCDQLYNLFVELISIGLILVELGYIGLLTVITIPLGIFFLAAAVAFDVFGYLVLGLDIACFLIQSIMQFIF